MAGAGEQLADIRQAWAVQHMDPTIAERNLKLLSGLATMLNRYPDVYLEVHGETGAADAAPRQLAAYLGMDRTAQVGSIMDKLAELRAKACIASLVGLGVARERLIPTYNGMGRNIRVNFLPRTMRPYGPLQDESIPELAMIYEGVTSVNGLLPLLVFCRSLHQ